MARFELRVSFDDKLSSWEDGKMYVEMAASLAVDELRKVDGIALGDVELIDHDVDVSTIPFTPTLCEDVPDDVPEDDSGVDDNVLAIREA